MKKTLVLLFCSFCLVMAALGREVIRYSDLGGCELIIRHKSSKIGRYKTTYGLAIRGKDVLAPVCVMWRNEAMHLVVFRQELGLYRYRLWVYATDSGQCLCEYGVLTNSNQRRKPYITFEREREFVDVVLHYSRSIEGRVVWKKDVLGSFCRKGGKTYQLLCNGTLFEC